MSTQFHSRLTRLEAHIIDAHASVSVQATNDDGIADALLDAVLACSPGLIRLLFDVGGRCWEELIDILPHEEALEALA